MPPHPALTPGRVAVVTGAASGIGLAAARRFARLGLKVALADVDTGALEAATAVIAADGTAAADLLAMPTDVADRGAVTALRDAVLARWGEVGVLMNNAGREGGGQIFGDPDRWRTLVETNLWGPIHGVQTFVPGMVAQGTPGLVVNTGSKQGITCPPGDTAYNLTKAGVKVLTEALAHELRQAPESKVTAALLIPGFTYTGFTKAAQKPAAAWTADQVIDELMAGLARGYFYILCPDHAVTRAMDEKRMRWAADDVIQNRPALSRWHPDHAAAFAAWMAG